MGLVLLAVVAFVVWRVMFQPQQKAQADRGGALQVAAPTLGLTYAGQGDPTGGDPTFPYEYQRPRVGHVLRGSSLRGPAFVFDVRYEVGVDPPVVHEHTLAAFTTTQPYGADVRATPPRS